MLDCCKWNITPRSPSTIHIFWRLIKIWTCYKNEKLRKCSHSMFSSRFEPYKKARKYGQKKQTNYFNCGLKLFQLDQLKLPWWPYVSIILYGNSFGEPKENACLNFSIFNWFCRSLGDSIFEVQQSNSNFSPICYYSRVTKGTVFTMRWVNN